MPMLADLEQRFSALAIDVQDFDGEEETLVADNRAKFSPAQLVDQKLRSVLQNGQFVAEHVISSRLRKPR